MSHKVYFLNNSSFNKFLKLLRCIKIEHLRKGIQVTIQKSVPKSDKMFKAVLDSPKTIFFDYGIKLGPIKMCLYNYGTKK